MAALTSGRWTNRDIAGQGRAGRGEQGAGPEHAQDDRSRPGRHQPGQPRPRGQAAGGAQAAGHQGEQERRDHRLPERGRRLRAPAGQGQGSGQQGVGQGEGDRGVADVPQPGDRAARTTHRPATASSAPGSTTSPSGSRPIRPAPWTVTPTWCATSHSRAAVRSTPPSPVPRPTCGAVIQPIAVSVVSAASPLAAAANAAMPPVTTSGRAGRLGPPDPARWPAAGGRGSSGSRAGGASAETLTNPILATRLRLPKQARRPPG